MRIVNYFLCFLLVISCSSHKKINQYIKTAPKVQQRHGLWEEKYDTDGGTLIARGHYNRGEKIGVWKTTFEGKKYQKDRIRNGIIKSTIYHPNGKVMEKGQSKTDISNKERNWYYFGDWKFYNDKGELIYIKKYLKGNKIDSIAVKNKK